MTLQAPHSCNTSGITLRETTAHGCCNITRLPSSRQRYLNTKPQTVQYLAILNSQLSDECQHTQSKIESRITKSQLQARYKLLLRRHSVTVYLMEADLSHAALKTTGACTRRDTADGSVPEAARRHAPQGLQSKSPPTHTLLLSSALSQHSYRKKLQFQSILMGVQSMEMRPWVWEHMGGCAGIITNLGAGRHMVTRRSFVSCKSTVKASDP